MSGLDPRSVEHGVLTDGEDGVLKQQTSVVSGLTVRRPDFNPHSPTANFKTGGRRAQTDA